MVKSFGFQACDIIADKYEIINYLGGGWEGEVYKIRELKTRIERAAKVFFPMRNLHSKTSTTYAKKLHKLRSCPILIHYHTIESIEYEVAQVNVFISEFVEGVLLKNN